MHWIYPSIGAALFGFGMAGSSDAILTYVIDSYRDVSRPKVEIISHELS